MIKMSVEIELNVVVDRYFEQQPMGMWADSDQDCYGYTELEWHLEDDKGNKVEAKMPNWQVSEIEDAIYEYIKRVRDEDAADAAEAAASFRDDD